MEDYGRKARTTKYYQIRQWLCNTAIGLPDYVAGAFLSKRNAFPDELVMCRAQLCKSLGPAKAPGEGLARAWLGSGRGFWQRNIFVFKMYRT